MWDGQQDQKTSTPGTAGGTVAAAGSHRTLAAGGACGLQRCARWWSRGTCWGREAPAHRDTTSQQQENKHQMKMLAAYHETVLGLGRALCQGSKHSKVHFPYCWDQSRWCAEWGAARSSCQRYSWLAWCPCGWVSWSGCIQGRQRSGWWSRWHALQAWSS